MSAPLCNSWTSEKRVMGWAPVTAADRKVKVDQLLEALRAACVDFADNVSFVKRHMQMYLQLDSINKGGQQETRLRLGLFDLTPLVDTRLSCEDFWKSVWPNPDPGVFRETLASVTQFTPEAKTGVVYSINTAEPFTIHWLDHRRISPAYMDFDSNASVVTNTCSSDKWIHYRNVFVASKNLIGGELFNMLAGPLTKATQQKEVDRDSSQHRFRILNELGSMLLAEALNGFKASVVFSINQAIYTRIKSYGMDLVPANHVGIFRPEVLITTVLVATSVTKSIASGRLLVPSYDPNFKDLAGLPQLDLVCWSRPYTLVDTVVPPKVKPGPNPLLYRTTQLVVPAKKFTIKDILKELDEDAN